MLKGDDAQLHDGVCLHVNNFTKYIALFDRFLCSHLGKHRLKGALTVD